MKCYLLQLRHTWEMSFRTLSTDTMFNRTVKMFLDFTLASDIEVLFFIICSHAMSFNQVHFQARTVVKYSRATLCRTRNWSIAFSLQKCFYRRTNFFYSSRHVKFWKLTTARALVESQPRPPLFSAANMADGKRFGTPKRRLAIEKHSFQDEKERYRCHVEDHPFNHSVWEVLTYR